MFSEMMRVACSRQIFPEFGEREYAQGVAMSQGIPVQRSMG